jgi:uncharacterized YkwD family protein
MKKIGKMTKWLTAGAIALAVAVPSGAASAASNTTVQYKVVYNQVNLNGDWSTLLNQYLQRLTKPNPATATTAQKPTTNTSASTNTKPATTTTTTTTNASYAQQVATLVNQERAKAGLKALTMDSALSNVALAKAKDMYNNNYFSHTSPTYGSPFDMMKSFGIKYSYAGENIAKGQKTPQEVMNAWMNSAGHKANILGANYSKIGVAYYNGVWVQMFIG